MHVVNLVHFYYIHSLLQLLLLMMTVLFAPFVCFPLHCRVRTRVVWLLFQFELKWTRFKLCVDFRT